MEGRRIIEVILGAFVATALVPAVALRSGVALTGPRAKAKLVAGWLVVAAVVVVLARTVDDLPVRATTKPVVAAVVVTPLSYLAYVLVATEPGSTAAALSVVGAFAVVPGLFVPVGGLAVRSRRLRRRATEQVVVSVGDPSDDGDRQQALAAAFVLVGVVLVGLGALVLVGGDTEMTPVISALGGLSSLAAILGDDESEVAVTDEGVRVDRSFTRWERLAGYRVTDESVALVRDEWYLPASTFDREGLADDEETRLLEGLAEHLPRLDEDDGVETTPRR